MSGTCPLLQRFRRKKVFGWWSIFKKLNEDLENKVFKLYVLIICRPATGIFKQALSITSPFSNGTTLEFDVSQITPSSAVSGRMLSLPKNRAHSLRRLKHLFITIYSFCFEYFKTLMKNTWDSLQKIARDDT